MNQRNYEYGGVERERAGRAGYKKVTAFECMHMCVCGGGCNVGLEDSL